MKHVFLLFFIIIASCQVKKELVDDSNFTNKQSQSNCPEDGVCTFEVIKNKSAEIKKDEFGASYLNLSKSENVLLKFEYIKNEIPNTQDSSYIEIIYLELTLGKNGYQIKDINNNAIFGRLCFCRGQTGYYEIVDNNLKFTKVSEATYNINLDFKINEVPQVISKINETFSIK